MVSTPSASSHRFLQFVSERQISLSVSEFILRTGPMEDAQRSGELFEVALSRRPYSLLPHGASQNSCDGVLSHSHASGTLLHPSRSLLCIVPLSVGQASGGWGSLEVTLTPGIRTPGCGGTFVATGCAAGLGWRPWPSSPGPGATAQMADVTAWLSSGGRAWSGSARHW